MIIPDFVKSERQKKTEWLTSTDKTSTRLIGAQRCLLLVLLPGI